MPVFKVNRVLDIFTKIAPMSYLHNCLGSLALSNIFMYIAEKYIQKFQKAYIKLKRL